MTKPFLFPSATCVDVLFVDYIYIDICAYGIVFNISNSKKLAFVPIYHTDLREHIEKDLPWSVILITKSSGATHRSVGPILGYCGLTTKTVNWTQAVAKHPINSCW